MRRHDDPTDFGMVLTVIRLLRGWSQADMARAAGLSVGTVSRYETRARLPAREAVDRIAVSAGLSARLVDRLLDWIGAARAELEGLEAEPPVPSKPRAREMAPVRRETEEMEMDLHRALDGLFGSLSGPSLWPGDRYRMRRPESPTETPEEDRRGARELWSRLERLEADDRILLVDEGTEYQSWALCELVCEKCLEAMERPREALELAELAVFISERIGGPEAWKQRLQGYASAHLGHVRTAGGNLRGAARAFLRARRLWEAGAFADPGILDEALFRALAPETPQDAEL